ncbi:MAG: caspase family protein, partial [Clostridia bacterium]|nr:caspase family protein [Clostridia bacterium]
YGAYSAPRLVYPVGIVNGVRATVSATSGNVVLTWNTVPNAHKYKIFASSTENGTYSDVVTVLAKTTATQSASLDPSLKNKYLKIRTVRDDDGTRSHSAYSTPVKPATSAPSKPTGVTATKQGTSSIKVTWNKVTGATGYYVYRSNSASGTYSKIATITSGSTVSYTNTGLSAGTTYYYKVAAYNSIGTSAQSSYASATTNVILPTIPTGFAASAQSSSSIKLTWTKVSSATGYYIYRSTSSSGTYSKIATITSGSTVSYTNTGLSAGTKYYYRIAAYNSAGTSPQSGYVYATTQAAANPVTYRALLIGQTYPGTSNQLYGPANDQKAMKNMLNRLVKSDYQVTVASNLTGSGILSKIGEVFSKADSNDVTLLYYSGHGLIMRDAYGNYLYNHEETGSMCGTSGYVSPSQLRAKLDQYQGKKVVINDSCHSGNMIGKGLEMDSAAREKVEQEMSDAIVNGFMSAFRDTARANLAASNYYVLTAASKTQSSYEAGFSSTYVGGVFTTLLTLGCGWDGVNGVSSSYTADVNDNGWITLDEMYDWTKYAVDYVGYSSRQTLQVYPTNSSQNIMGI